MIYKLATHRFPAPFRAPDFESAIEAIRVGHDAALDLRVFRGIFGAASNELLSITAWDEGSPADISVDGAKTTDVEVLEPTVRPKTTVPLPEGGIYVLRWFTIPSDNFGEFVQLSDEAWVSMEAAFRAIIIGLFRAASSSEGKTRMLLYTWYESLAEWERSRDQRPEAGASEAWRRFLRRHLLTEFTSATVISEVALP